MDVDVLDVAAVLGLVPDLLALVRVPDPLARHGDVVVGGVHLLDFIVGAGAGVAVDKVLGDGEGAG